MYDAAFLSVVVTAEIVVVGRRAEIGGGEFRIEMLADIHAGRIEREAIEMAARNGERCVRAAVVKAYVVYICGEENFIVRIDRNRCVFPPEERAAHGCAVGNLHAGLENAAFVGKINADHSFHAVDGIVL